MGEEKISPPEWLSISYIEKALQKGLNHPTLKVKNCDFSRAAAIGDHYGSIMLRISLVLQTNEKDEDFSLVVKMPPPGKFLEATKDLKVFDREIKMFTKTLPAFTRILRKIYPKQENLCAECYFEEQDSEKIICIFLEDLRKSGFMLANRFACLDSDHTSLVLKSLAKFHAASLIHVDQDPDPISLYDLYAWSEGNREMMKGLYEKAVKVIAKNIETWEDFPKKDLYSQKMKALEGTIVDKVIDVYKFDESRLNVICHGDAWINNMMFRYDKNGKVNGMRFLDFQISHYNSPALDLNYFIFLSTQTRFTDVDSLLEIYHETFMETLNGLNYKLKKPFTLDDLKKEFKDKLFFGLAVVLCILPITTLPPSKAPNLDDLLEKEHDGAERIFNEKAFMDILKEALPFFEKYGVF